MVFNEQCSCHFVDLAFHYLFFKFCLIYIFMICIHSYWSLHQDWILQLILRKKIYWLFNSMSGRFLADLTKEVLSDIEAKKYQVCIHCVGNSWNSFVLCILCFSCFLVFLIKFFNVIYPEVITLICFQGQRQSPSCSLLGLYIDNHTPDTNLSQTPILCSVVNLIANIFFLQRYFNLNCLQGFGLF